MAVRTRLLTLGLALLFLASLMLLIASPALAAENGGDTPLGPQPENGLLVAVLGVLGIYIFLGFILWRVLRKRKKQMMQI
ncbi:MAG TPA: hypothetical protein VLU38_07845 [Methanomassiliicoccales archaeon]|nr:hypothetical protein [Methanomassiliicoccales archaeon]